MRYSIAAMTRCMAVEWAKDKIRVVNVAPGYIETDLNKAANTDRNVEIVRLDTGTDGAVVAERVGAYINANPDTTVYFDTGLWFALSIFLLKNLSFTMYFCD